MADAYEFPADWLDVMFTTDPAVIARNTAEAERIAKAEAEMRAADVARAAERTANRCPKCMGEGRLPQFSHRKGGACFTCGGTGVFTRYTA